MCWSLSLGDLVNRLGNIVHILGSERDNGETTVFSHVDAMVFLEHLHLVGVHPSIAEHANLFCDVRPVASGTWREGIEGRIKEC